MNTFHNVKAHTYGLLGALNELAAKFPFVQQRSPKLGDDADWDEFKRWASELKAVVDGTLAEVYQRIAVHTDALVQLTSDEQILAPVRRLSSLTDAEITDLRAAALEIGTVADEAGIRRWMVKWALGAFYIKLRRNQIDGATVELERYVKKAA